MPMIGRRFTPGLKRAAWGSMQSGDYPVPILHMKFGEGAGLTTRDSSPSGIVGTLKVPTWVDGYVGPGLDFEGLDDYVSVDDSTPLNLTGACTIIISIKPDRDDVLFNVFCSKSDAGTAEGYCFRTRHTATVPALEFRTQSNNHAVAAPELTLDAWHRAGVVYDGTLIEYFIEGISKGNPSSSHAPTTTDEVFEIGRLTGGSQWYNGSLDELLIFDEALTARQMREDALGIR